MERINTFLHQLPQRVPCPQQQGFQKKISCNAAAFNLQETILYNLELHSNVYVAFLDIRKAFDTVWHDALLYKLDKIGISNSYTMGCPPVRGDNPRALASGLSYVQVDNPWYN